MKKILTILWIIITAGILFMALHLVKTDPETNVDEPGQVTTSSTTATKPEVTPPTSTPKTYTEHLGAGDYYFENKKYDLAIREYENAFAGNPKSEKALYKLGQAYLANNRPEKAKQTFQQAIQGGSDSIEMQLGMAQALLNTRDIEKAKDLIWDLDENHPEVQYYTGIILILYKDFEGSKNKFASLVTETSLASKPTKDNSQKFLDAYQKFAHFLEGETVYLQTLLAKAFTETGQYEAAIPLIFDILNQKNNYRDAWLILGYSYLKTDNSPDAIDALNQAKILDPEKPETLFFLGLAYLSANDLDKAVTYLEEAEKYGYEPKDEIRLKLGDIYYLQREYEKSAQKYEEVIKLNPKTMNIFVRAVWLHIEKTKNLKKALEIAKNALENHPTDPMSYNLIGWTLVELEKYEEANRYLGKALELNPTFDAAYLNLGLLYEKQDMTTLAKEHYRKAYTLGHGNSISNLAAQHFNELKQQEALQALKASQNAAQSASQYYKVDISSP